MAVHPATAQHQSQYQGKNYDFYAPGRRMAFDSDPQAYLDPSYRLSM